MGYQKVPPKEQGKNRERANINSTSGNGCEDSTNKSGEN